MRDSDGETALVGDTVNVHETGSVSLNGGFYPSGLIADILLQWDVILQSDGRFFKIINVGHVLGAWVKEGASEGTVIRGGGVAGICDIRAISTDGPYV